MKISTETLAVEVKPICKYCGGKLSGQRERRTGKHPRCALAKARANVFGI